MDPYEILSKARDTLSDVREQHEQMKRQFDTGANRSDDSQKPDYEGYLNPLVIEEFGRYMLAHQYEGKRTSDNWQKGMPHSVYLKSMLRHVITRWRIHRVSGTKTEVDKAAAREALCAIIFNAQGDLLELLRESCVQGYSDSLRAVWPLLL